MSYIPEGFEVDHDHPDYKRSLIPPDDYLIEGPHLVWIVNPKYLKRKVPRRPLPGNVALKIAHAMKPTGCQPGRTCTGACKKTNACGFALEIVQQLLKLDDQARRTVLQAFCSSCGSKDPRCQCWNDE